MSQKLNLKSLILVDEFGKGTHQQTALLCSWLCLNVSLLFVRAQSSRRTFGKCLKMIYSVHVQGSLLSIWLSWKHSLSKVVMKKLFLSFTSRKGQGAAAKDWSVHRERAYL